MIAIRKARNAISGAIYRQCAKPLFFRQDPETVHNRITRMGQFLGGHTITRWLTRRAFGYHHPMLSQTIAGIHFDLPVGLSAGFDKEGVLTQIIPDVGFGFMEVGSITGQPTPGNARPRLWRLPKSQSLVVHFGLNSSGSVAVAQRLRGLRTRIPLGVSIAKANIPATDGIEQGIADYRLAAEQLSGLGDYLTINISCPNTSGGEPFTQPAEFRQLLTTLAPWIMKQPTFIKMPADVTNEQIDQLVDIALELAVTGFICTNLTKRRDLTTIVDATVPPKGGLSGKVIEPRANEVIARVYRRTQGRAVIIGVGGIFSATDAYKKIRLGSSLLQMITGMIYHGPQLISEIHLGLVDLLRRDGFTNISQAVGVDTPVE